MKANKRVLIEKAAGQYLSLQEKGDCYDAYQKLLRVQKQGKGEHLAFTYVEIWEPFQNYNVAQILSFIESAIEQYEIPKFFENIDWKLLKEQKLNFINAIEVLEFKAMYSEYASDIQKLNKYVESCHGILNLIDAIQDWAVDEMGIPENEVFNLNIDE